MAARPERSRSRSPPPLSRPSFDLKGKRYIVTGGTQGMGLDIARQMKALGAAGIALLSRTRSKGEEAIAELNGGGCKVIFVEADMTAVESLQAAAEAAIKGLHGRVDGLVNNAGDTEVGNLSTTSAELFDKHMAIHVRAPFLLTQVLAKYWINEKISGSVVNISAASSKTVYPAGMTYSVSKNVLNFLSKLNAAELARYGIRVNVVLPCWTPTTPSEKRKSEKKWGHLATEEWMSAANASFPQKRCLVAQDTAVTVCYLFSPASEMLTGSEIAYYTPGGIPEVNGYSSVESTVLPKPFV